MSDHESEAEKKRQRQEYEQIMVATSMMFIMDEIPGLGEIAMVGMALDMIDPYGYNKSLNRGVIDKVMSKGMGSISDTQLALSTYLQHGISGLSDDQLAMLKIQPGGPAPDGLVKAKKGFDSLHTKDDPPGLTKSQQLMLNKVMAWGNVVQPEALADKEQSLKGCMVDPLNDQDIIKECKNDLYKNAYLKFWNDNKAKYEKDQVNAAADYWESYFSQDQKEQIVEQDNTIQGHKAKVAGLFTATGILTLGLLIYFIFFFPKRVSSAPPSTKSVVIRWIIFIIGVIAVAVMTAMIYNKTAGDKPTTTQKISKHIPVAGGSATGFDLKDWRLVLNRDAHSTAKREWCTQSGYSFDGTSGLCTVNEDACNAASNKTYQAGDKKPFLRWIDGKCVVSSMAGVMKEKVCENKIFSTDFQANLAYHDGEITCDENGSCGFGGVDCSTDENLDTGKCPTCIISSDYCNSKGLDYEDVNGLGDCSESDVQAVFEAIFGKTLVRTYKRNWQNMQKQCAHQLLSFNCAESIGTFWETPVEMGVRTVQKIINDLVDNFKKECGGDFTSTANDFVNCAWAIMKFNPIVLATSYGVKMLDGMLTGLFGWTGMPHNVIARGVGYAVKYGIVAATAVFHYGLKAIQAIDKGAHMAVAALDRCGIAGRLTGAALLLGIEACEQMVKYGLIAAKAIAHVGVAAIHLAVKYAVKALHVLNAAIGAALHPVDLAKHLYNDIVSSKAFATSVVDAVKALKAAGKLSKQSYHMFMAGVKIEGEALADVSAAMDKAAAEVAANLANAASSAWHHVSSIF